MKRARSYKAVMFIGLLVVVMLSVQLFAVEPAAQPSRSRRSGLYGDWEIKIDYGRGQMNSILSFSMGAEGKRTGSWISFWGLNELKDIKIEEDKLSFTQEYPGRDGQTRTSKFAGTIKDGKLTGTLTSERGESKVEGKRSRRTPRAVGSWELKLKMGEREFASTLVITAAKKEDKESTEAVASAENALSAEWKSEYGEHEVSDVKYERGKLTFKRKSKMRDRQWDSTFEGTIRGPALSGVIKSERGEITIEGKQAGAALIGTWNLEIESERGKRKQRLKVNPDMSGLYGATDVKKVDLEGDKVSFKIALEFGERKFEMNFAGKLEESKLVGEMTTSRGVQKVTGSKVVRRYRGRRRRSTVNVTETTDAAKQLPRVHAVSNIGHEFCFYADGSFHGQYLPDQPVATSWGALYNFDFSNTNMLILLCCDSHLKYLPRDIRVIREFLKDGGGVVLFGNAGDNPQNELATLLGCSFKGLAKKPFKAVSDEITGDIQNDLDWGTTDWMELQSGQDWQVLIVDADNKPMLARKKVGKGTLLIAARGLSGSRPDGKDNINAEWWKPLLKKTAQGKKVDPAKPFKSRGLVQLEYMEELGNIKLHYSEYLKPYAQAMIDIYKRTKPFMRKRMGVPLSDGMAGAMGLLATGGGGFSSGEMLGLGVFWGGFPEREDSMIEFITHETVHSWVLPFSEIWNEPIATYVGNLVMVDMGYEEEGMRRINLCIDNAKKIDPTMKLYDLNGKSQKDIEPLTGDKMLEMRWGKTYWIFEELRKENPDILADYFIAKRKLAQPGIIRKYDASATVAVVSVAMGKDMFSWFREYGFDVNAEKSEIKADLNTVPSAGIANAAKK